jgi:hypothetical protein
MKNSHPNKIQEDSFSLEREKAYACISLTPNLYEKMRAEALHSDVDPTIAVQQHLKWLSEQPPESISLEVACIDYCCAGMEVSVEELH